MEYERMAVGAASMHDDSEKALQFAPLLRAWRRHNNIKQTALASSLGVSQPAIARWERGLDMPSAPLMARLRDMMRASNASELTLQRLFTERQMGIRALFNFDDLSLVASSVGFRELWPQSAALAGIAMRDELVNEAHIVGNDARLRGQILEGTVGLISGVSTRQLRLQIDVAVRHQWHVSSRRYGTAIYADMVYEPCDQSLAPGINDIVRYDMLTA